MPNDVIHIFVQGAPESGRTRLFGSSPLRYKETPNGERILLTIRFGAITVNQLAPQLIFYCVDLGKQVIPKLLELEVGLIRQQPGYSKKNTLICLVGTKADLPGAEEQFETLTACAKQLGLGDPVRTSAERSEGMTQLNEQWLFLTTDAPKITQMQRQNLYHQAKVALQQSLLALPWRMRQKIRHELKRLESGRRTPLVFYQNCMSIIGHRYSVIRRALTLLAVVAAVFLLVAMIGLGIGAAAIGIGVLISGLAAGTAAAVGAFSTALVSSAGCGYIAHRFMKPPKKAIAQEAQQLVRRLGISHL